MIARHRTHFRTASSGSYYSYGTPPTVEGPYPYTLSDFSIDDYIGKKKDPVTGLTPSSPMTSFKRWVKPPLFGYYHHYSFHPDFVYTELKNIPGQMNTMTGAVGTPPGGWASIEPTDNEAVVKLLANSNPFRYTISIPVMILELVDATSLLKIAAKTFAGLFGGAFLNWHFGYELMLKDIQTLATITKSIEDRVKEFNDLISKGGSRRRVFLSKRTTRSEEIRTMFSGDQGAWGGPNTTTYTSKVWGSVNWRPQRGKELEVQALSDFNSAVRHVLDLDSPDPSTVWEAIPFSWLVDYLVNIGDSLKAVENTDLVVPHDVCIMRERQMITKSSWDVTNSPPGAEPIRIYNCSGGEVQILMKNRSLPDVGDISDLLHFGFMTKAQSINLLALLASLRR